MLTFGQAKEILAKYNKRGGTCVTDPSLPQFVYKVLQQMLWSGTYGNLRKFCFCSQKGCITIPYELETIEKVKIDGCVGTSWDRWYEFHSSKDVNGCVPVANAMYEEPNYYPTVYDVPAGGSRVGVYGTCSEAADAHIIIKGNDPTGRQIVTSDNGEQIVGEKLYIRKGEIRYTQATFAEVSGVVKTPTNGYATLLWVDLVRNMKGFMADYSPLEQVPAYRRYKLTNPNCNLTSLVTVLGRIRLKEAYTDTDIIPFESLFTIEMMGQTLNLASNRALDLASANAQITSTLIENENSYKKPENGQPMEVFIPLSGGAIGNINGPFGWTGISGWGSWGRGRN